MNSYLITPAYMLGSDSFRVAAVDKEGAIAIAKKRIKHEGWHSPHGWDILLEEGSFEE